MGLKKLHISPGSSVKMKCLYVIKTKTFCLNQISMPDIKCEFFYFDIALISIFLTPLNVNFIFEGFLVVVSTGIETPLEFLFSSFLSITVEVAVVLLVVVICVVLVVIIS